MRVSLKQWVENKDAIVNTAKKRKQMIYIPTWDMTREQWLNTRHYFAGGSDIGTMANVNPYNSEVELLYQKIGIDPIGAPMNEAMFWGNIHEPTVADIWQYYDLDTEDYIANHLTGKKVRKSKRVNMIIVNPKYPWIGANIDRRILPFGDLQKHGVLECKTIMRYASDKWDGGIPPYYIFQIACYLKVTELDYGEYACLMDGRHLSVYPFHAADFEEEGIMSMVVEMTGEFMQKVEYGRKIWDDPSLTEDEKRLRLYDIEPEVADNWSDFLTAEFKNREDMETVVGLMEHINVAREYKRIQGEKKEAESELLMRKNILLNYMRVNNAEMIDFGDHGKVTYLANKKGVRQFRLKID